jgi:guanosine-3',5'-bis(diphosphate) 3'-pyrophosphohydrolase
MMSSAEPASANDAAHTFLVEAYRTRPRRRGRTVEHPIAVSELLADDGYRPTVVVAGLLHDVLEDTDVTPGELRERFGPDVTRLVEALTQDAAIGKYGERKATLRRQIIDAGPEAAIVSLADKTAKLQGTQARPKSRRMAHYAATLDGIVARYGDSRLSELLSQQLRRWPD